MEKIVIKSLQDNLNLDCLLSEQNVKKAVVVINHGMNEHKERYQDFMNFLTSNGYVCFIYDHRGHGKSLKDDSDLGYFYDNKAEYIVEDLEQVIKYLKDRYRNKNIYLFGHSMGSMVVRKYLSLYDDEINGLIVCGSPSENKYAKLGLAVIKMEELFKGDKYKSEFVKKLMFNNYNKNCAPNEWICYNKDILKKYNDDDLCQFTYTLNGYENIVRLMIDIYSKKIYKRKNLNIPIYFIAGCDDPVIVNKVKWIKAQEFLREIGYNNITSTLYSNMRHEILNEIDNKIVYSDILNWLNDNEKKLIKKV